MTVEAIERGDSDLLSADIIEAKRRLITGDQEGALALLAQLITNDTNDVPARFLLGLTAWKMGRLDWSLALTRECHDSRPMDGVIAEVLASLYAQAGDLQESLYMGKLATALKVQGPLLQLVPSEFPTFDWAFQNIQENPKLAAAEIHLANGKIDLAVEEARQHAALNLEDDAAQAFYAALLLRTGVASKAFEVLRRTENAVDVMPSQASIYARALTAVGSFDAARRWHDEAIGRAPDKADIVAARVADGLWLENDAQRLATISSAWVRRFCPPARPSQWTRPQGKLTIGYIVSAFADPLDAAYIAAVARAHDRKRVTVIGYGIGALGWSQNLPFQGAFDLWQDISSLDVDALALFFERDGLHAIVDVAGFAAPLNMLALARLQTAIRVAWLGNEGRMTAPIYDFHLVSTSADPKIASPWCVGGGYPVLQPQAVSPKPAAGPALKFGADVVMAQIDAETVRLWSGVLQQRPDATLLLCAHDMTSPAIVDRLVAMFGRDLAARIDIVSDEQPNDFYTRFDVALTPGKGVSPRMAAEALACGVVPIALGGSGFGKAYASFLEGVELGSALVASDPQDYATRAVRLATSAEARRQVLASLSASPWCGSDSVSKFADAIEDHARRALETAKALAI